MTRPRTLAWVLGAATLALVGSGCGETTSAADVSAASASSGTGPRAWAPAVTPHIGELLWRCDTSGDAPRFATRLNVARTEGTISGEVVVGRERPRVVRVDPGERFDTGLRSALSQEWTLDYRHATAQSRAHLRLTFGLDGSARDCVLRDLRLRQHTERR